MRTHSHWWYLTTRVLFVAAAVICAVPNTEAQALPAPPQVFLDTTYPVMTGATIFVPAGGDLQAALNSAQYGDTILLEAGATFTGWFTLPLKSGTGWIVVRTSAPNSSLPPAGTRITPAYGSVMPKIVSPDSQPALQTAPGAHHFRFTGVEFAVANGVPLNYGLIRLGDGTAAQDTVAEIPHNLVIDRCYIHGNPVDNQRYGVTLNCASGAVIDSYISDFHEVGADSQAIQGSNGPGPFKIVNNYLEGAGENLIFGGADPRITNLVPSDIEIRGNHFFKPLRWRIGDPSYAGIPWSVKNLFELKIARRVLVEGNIFEYNWAHAQNGFAILFTPRNQDGTAPWSVVEDVTFTRNIVRHTGSGMNILGYDNIFSSQQTKRILIRGNLFEDVDGAKWGGAGRLFQITNGTADVTIDHNTAFQTGDIITADSLPNLGFVYTNNLTPHNEYGVGGTGTFGNPMLTLTTYFPGAVFVKNVLVGGNPLNYPPDNFFPPTMADVKFVDLAGGNYRLASDSPYKNAGTDGKDIGANIDALPGSSGPSPPPPPPPLPDTTPPSVSITEPLPGATVSGIIPVSATASDNVGVVGVRFYLDGAALGNEDTTVPYSISWDTTTAANGSHTLTAVARDAAGNSNTSAPVTVTVANVLPPAQQLPYKGTPFQVPGRFEAEDFDKGGEGIAYHDAVAGNAGGLYRPSEDVDIISPYAGGYAVNNFQSGEWLEYTISVTQSALYTFEVLASSQLVGSRWRIEIDGVDVTGPVTVPTTGSWATFQWVGKAGISLSAGLRILRMVAEQEYFNLDAIRLSQDGAPSDTTPPTVEITAPNSGATVANTVTVSANASDNVGVAGVQFYLDGAALGGEDTTTPYAVSWDTTTAANGSHTLTAVARDGASNSTTSAPVTVTVANSTADTTPPTVAITAPSSGATVANTVTISANASDNVGVAGVQFYRDGTALGGEDTTAPYAVSWDTTAAANGSHTLTAVARDTEGNRTTSAPVTVTVANSTADAIPPTVAITAPSSGTSVANRVTISASASDNVGVAGVRFYLDGAALGGWDTTAPYAVSWDTTTASGGSHTLKAVARDAAGNSTTSTPVTVTVANSAADTTPPTVAITAPSSGTTVANGMMISANASDNVSVTGVRFYLDGLALGVEDTTAPYEVSWDTNTVGNGSHTLTAVAQDAAGNSATSLPVNVTVANSLPSGQQSPYQGLPFQVPGGFEAEDFDKGGEGIAYHDLTPRNQGGYYRLSEGVDIIAPYAGGYVINGFQASEWLEYTINVSQSGMYQLEVLVSTEYSTSRFHIEVDGTNKASVIEVPSTGSWRAFQWVGGGGMSLSAGQHVLRIYADAEYFDLDAIRIVASNGRSRPVRQ